MLQKWRNIFFNWYFIL